MFRQTGMLIAKVFVFRVLYSSCYKWETIVVFDFVYACKAVPNALVIPVKFDIFVVAYQSTIALFPQGFSKILLVQFSQRSF